MAGTPPARATPTQRVFAPGDQLVYSYEVYNAAQSVNAAPSVWHDGVQIFKAVPDTLAAPSVGPGMPLKVAGGIRLAPTLAPGDYVFQLAATSKGPKGHSQTVVRQTDFQVH